jgi:hypothetical protein
VKQQRKKEKILYKNVETAFSFPFHFDIKTPKKSPELELVVFNCEIGAEAEML